MTEAHQENLSAGIDGELSKEELRFLLRRLDHETALLDTWTRYHTARSGLRRELPLLASGGFAARVMLAIDAEAGAATRVPDVAVSAAGGRRGRWLRWSAGGAIAAGVAVAALMVAQPTADSDTRSATAQVATTPSEAPSGVHEQLAAAATPAPSVLQGTGAPATVPPWLSGNAASRLSERASMTLGAPANDPMRPYQVRGYRTLSNGDGSYLLLIDPSQVASHHDRQAASAGQ
jgi:sigma-E factor negative regulatory protein RseA